MNTFLTKIRRDVACCVSGKDGARHVSTITKITKIAALTVIFGLSINAAYAQNTYVITKSSSNFVVSHNGGYLGSGNASLQAKINDIRADANGNPCTIQFGNGTDVLNIGSSNSTIITFENSGAQTWAEITLTGKATSSGIEGASIIRLEENITVNCKAELTEINDATLLYINGGTLTVSSGAIVSATSGTAIRNFGWDCYLSINGGIVSATSGIAIANGSKLRISGGSVRATESSGIAIRNGRSSDGVESGGFTISGDAVIESANTMHGTIYMLGVGVGGIGGKIEGGTVRNTSEENGAAIYNELKTGITVSGGVVETTNGMAIRNFSNGEITVSGGTVQARGEYGTAIQNASTGNVTVSGGTILATSGEAISNLATAVVSISGGTLRSENSNAISNLTGTVNISGGIILAREHYAVANSGTLTISGGIVFAYGTAIEGSNNVIYGTYTRSGNGVLVAWDAAAGTTTYTAGDTTDIVKEPATATVVWSKEGSTGGIAVSYTGNTGFIPLAEVTVGGTGIADITANAKIDVYPNPTSGQLRITNYESSMGNVEIYDVYGRTVETRRATSLQSDGTPNTATLDISHLPAGVYFLRVGNGTAKVVKQ